ncbi:MAG: NAD-dependent epimerase/dehydratase family protein [Patescibacteria group bacterium]
MKNKKIIVTGGAGFIGSNLVDELVNLGAEVMVIDNMVSGNRDYLNPKAKFAEVDICNLEVIKPLFLGVDYVFHLAALPRVQYSIEHPLETDLVNVGGTRNVLIAAKEGGVKRVIYSASSSAYGDQEMMPLTEDLPANPKSPYGLQKYLGEWYLKTWSQVFGLETVSLRYFNVYGPRFSAEGAYALVIGKFLKQRALGEPLTVTGDGTQTRDFTHVSDVVRANLLAATVSKVGKGEVINIGSGKNYSINEIAKIIGGPIKYVEARLEPHDTLADNSLAKKLLGWVPKESIEKAIKELKNEKV